MLQENDDCLAGKEGNAQRQLIARMLNFGNGDTPIPDLMNVGLAPSGLGIIAFRNGLPLPTGRRVPLSFGPAR
jgi:hypothetical protein